MLLVVLVCVLAGALLQALGFGCADHTVEKISNGNCGDIFLG